MKAFTIIACMVVTWTFFPASAGAVGRYRLMMLGLHDISEKVFTLLPSHKEEQKHGLMPQEGSI